MKTSISAGDRKTRHGKSNYARNAEFVHEGDTARTPWSAAILAIVLCKPASIRAKTLWAVGRLRSASVNRHRYVRQNDWAPKQAVAYGKLFLRSLKGM
jgi:hypothetical protein